MPYEDLIRDIAFVNVMGGAPQADHLKVQLQFTELEAVVCWSSPAALEIEGAVPFVDRTLRLRPERGVGGAVEAVGEIEVDDKVIDAAWVIRGDDAALLVHMQPELRALADLAPSIQVAHENVTIKFEKLAHENEKRAIEGALSVWHRVAYFRLG